MKSKGIRKRYLLLALLFFFAIFYGAFIYDFLSVTKACNKHEVMVVEGWLPDDALQLAADEFVRDQYSYILIAGFSTLFKGYLMGSGGKMEFALKDSVDVAQDKIYTISIWIRGTPADRKYAHFTLYADSILLGSAYTKKNKQRFNFVCTLSAPPAKIWFEFDNDTVTSRGDRNLFVYGITVNKKHFLVNQPNVTCYTWYRGHYQFFERLNQSNAEKSASFLKTTGIKDSLIIPITATRKLKSKTYSMAIEVRRWLTVNEVRKPYQIHIFTQGVHARRSLLSFKKAFGESACIGVISCPDNTIAGYNWWKTWPGFSRIIAETTGILWVYVFIRAV